VDAGGVVAITKLVHVGDVSGTGARPKSFCLFHELDHVRLFNRRRRRSFAVVVALFHMRRLILGVRVALVVTVRLEVEYESSGTKLFDERPRLL
jgi:hypothetical protein